jgi:hypothetical protein
MSRATRVGGLVARSGRAAHESTFASHEGAPGTRSVYGEVRCDALKGAFDTPGKAGFEAGAARRLRGAPGAAAPG